MNLNVSTITNKLQTLQTARRMRFATIETKEETIAKIIREANPSMKTTPCVKWKVKSLTPSEHYSAYHSSVLRVLSNGQQLCDLHISLFGKPSIHADGLQLGTDTVHILRVADVLKKRGCYLRRPKIYNLEPK